VGIDLDGYRPPQLAARLGSRRSLDCGPAKEMHEKVKTACGDAPHLVARDGLEVVDAVPGLFKELPTGGIFQTLVPIHASAGQEPCAGEWPGSLFHDQDPTRGVDARDDRGGAPARYGFLVGVGVGNGGSVKVGTGNVGVAPGVRVGTGVSDGDGDGHGSGPTRFQV